MSENLKPDLDSLTSTEKRDGNRAWFDAHHSELKAQYGPNAFVVIENKRVTEVITNPAQIDSLRTRLRKEGRADSAFWRIIGEQVLALTIPPPAAPLEPSVEIRGRVTETVEISPDGSQDIDDKDTTA